MNSVQSLVIFNKYLVSSSCKFIFHNQRLLQLVMYGWNPL